MKLTNLIATVELSDGDKIEGTPNHWVWSVSRHEFVKLHLLKPGEFLDTSNGLPVTVESVSVAERPQPVYNLEVDGQHVYRIGHSGVLVHNNGDCANAAKEAAEHAGVKAADFPWGNAGSRQAARAIEAGETSITVSSRSHASEVVWRMFSSRGFLNTTGRTGSDVRTILGSKAGTYHWDEAIDATGWVAGHGASNAHGALPHVQIHDELNNIIRIFFPAP